MTPTAVVGADDSRAQGAGLIQLELASKGSDRVRMGAEGVPRVDVKGGTRAARDVFDGAFGALAGPSGASRWGGEPG